MVNVTRSRLDSSRRGQRQWDPSRDPFKAWTWEGAVGGPRWRRPAFPSLDTAGGDLHANNDPCPAISGPDHTIDVAIFPHHSVREEAGRLDVSAIRQVALDIVTVSWKQIGSARRRPTLAPSDSRHPSLRARHARATSRAIAPRSGHALVARPDGRAICGPPALGRSTGMRHDSSKGARMTTIDPTNRPQPKPRRRHGLGADGIEALRSRQDGKCAICAKPETDAPAVAWPSTTIMPTVLARSGARSASAVSSA